MHGTQRCMLRPSTGQPGGWSAATHPEPPLRLSSVLDVGGLRTGSIRSGEIRILRRSVRGGSVGIDAICVVRAP
eukprot:5832013-Alexandrium_andersonii.AAC.1